MLCRFVALSLCLFRESFPFAVITLGLSLTVLWPTWRRVGAAVFGIGIAFQVFNYVIRPMLLGDIMDYGGHVLNEDTLHMILSNDYKPLLKILYPFFPILYLIIYKRNILELIRDPLIQVFAFLAPLAAIHIITGKFHFQYGAQFAAPLLAVIGFHPSVNISNVSKKVMIATVVLSIVSGMSIYTKAFNTVILSKSNKCEISKENKENLIELKRFFDERIKNTDRVLVTGGIAPLY